MYVLTDSHNLVNLDHFSCIYLSGIKNPNMKCVIKAETPNLDGEENLAVFRNDLVCVAKDVYDQFLFAVSRATSPYTVIDLEQIAKKALYEFDTGKVYEG